MNSSPDTVIQSSLPAAAGRGGEMRRRHYPRNTAAMVSLPFAYTLIPKVTTGPSISPNAVRPLSLSRCERPIPQLCDWSFLIRSKLYFHHDGLIVEIKPIVGLISVPAPFEHPVP